MKLLDPFLFKIDEKFISLRNPYIKFTLQLEINWYKIIDRKLFPLPLIHIKSIRNGISLGIIFDALAHGDKTRRREGR